MKIRIGSFTGTFTVLDRSSPIESFTLSTETAVDELPRFTEPRRQGEWGGIFTTKAS
jgi:hypothetical protein